jgi:CheY-like chemotaxis protein
MKKSRVVLLVDDDPITHFINEKVLRKSGIVNEIQTANNGKEALDAIKFHYDTKGQAPDLIFLDINMPVMDGFEFLDNLADLKIKNKENTRIIILSSSINESDIEKAKEMKIETLTKPLTVLKLKDILDN